VAVLVTAAVSGAPSPDPSDAAASADKYGVTVMTVGGANTEALALSDAFRVRADGVDAALADLGARVAAALCAAPPRQQSLSQGVQYPLSYPWTNYEASSIGSSAGGTILQAYIDAGAVNVTVLSHDGMSTAEACHRPWWDECQVACPRPLYCLPECEFRITYTGTLELGKRACLLAASRLKVSAGWWRPLCTDSVPA
jgi:hypothetical protein